MIALSAILIALFSSAGCVTRGSAVRVYLEADHVTARDSVVRVRLCLTTSAKHPSVASMSARILYDATAARIDDASKPLHGPPLMFQTAPGSVSIAGALAKGLGSGTMLTLVVRLKQRGVRPRLDLVVSDLNGPNGRSLATEATITGLAAECVAGHGCSKSVPPAAASTVKCAGSSTTPRIAAMTPRQATSDPGTPLEITIDGCFFHATRNVVRVGEVTLRDVPSTSSGTRIHVVVPKEIRGSGEAPPMQMGAGTYNVSVNNGRGASNVVRLTLR